MPIEITDEFAEPTGEFTNYDVIPANQLEGLKTQKHVDIRSFIPEQLSSTVKMLYMDRLTMFDLDEHSLSTFSAGKIVVINNEGWTFGEVGPQTDRNMWNGISVECKKETTTTTQSVIKQN